MIYFDNAASGGFKPECVTAAVQRCLHRLSVNAGRSSHKRSVEALRLITETRRLFAAYAGLEAPERVIFTKNCTEALNLAILGIIKEGGEVILSVNEHNSVIRPCYEAERQGRITVRVAVPDDKGCVHREDVEALMSDKTCLVCVSHVSNVTGGTSDVHGIAALCRKRSVPFLSDCAQSGGHETVDMSQGADLTAFAGHKGLLSPQGIGVLCVSPGIELRPLMYGGTGTDSHSVYQPEELPEALECGTLNLPAVAGLNAALKFLSDNETRLLRSMENNFDYLYTRLHDMPEIRLYSYPNRCGILSLLLTGYDSMELADLLDSRFDIAVRAGLHCAPLMHRHLGTLKTGLLRVSLSPFNTISEIKLFIDALERIAQEG